MVTFRRKAANGTGNVLLRSDGRWMARITAHNSRLGSSRRLCAYGNSEDEANFKLAILKTEWEVAESEDWTRRLAILRAGSIYGISAWAYVNEDGLARVLAQTTKHMLADLEMVKSKRSVKVLAIRRLEQSTRVLQPILGE